MKAMKPDWSGRTARDNRTAIELFLAGTRALALHPSVVDVVRTVSRFSSMSRDN